MDDAANDDPPGEPGPDVHAWKTRWAALDDLREIYELVMDDRSPPV